MKTNNTLVTEQAEFFYSLWGNNNCWDRIIKELRIEIKREEFKRRCTIRGIDTN